MPTSCVCTLKVLASSDPIRSAFLVLSPSFSHSFAICTNAIAAVAIPGSPDLELNRHYSEQQSGIVPVGAFLFEHILISNSTAINGPEAYANQVKFLGSLPLVLFLEAFGIWLPIAFHGLFGFYIWFRGGNNTARYPWTGNWMYT